MTQPSLAFVTQQVSPSDNGIRTGTVFSVDLATTRATVYVGGTPMELQYLNREYPPVVGDTVALVRQDASWLVLGSIAGEPVRRNGIVGAGVSSTTTTLTSGVVNGSAEVAVTDWVQEPGFTAVPGRYYRVMWEGRTFVSGASITLAFGQVRLREGSASTTNPVLANWVIESQSNFIAYTVNHWCLIRYRGTQEKPVTLSLTLAKAAGTGSNINLVGDTLSLLTVTIEDVTDVLLPSEVSVMAGVATEFTYSI